MTGRIGRNYWLAAAGFVVLAVLAWAWIDGGERELRPVSEAVDLPEISQ